ncbi:MAG TPA: chromate resistance protein ChrB domain-containing protein [Parvularculaceae bacterium]|nr:chromate resistance protein ChrB domain-containing protein [Parvularculaceae bacterium]
MDRKSDPILTELFGERRPSRWITRERPKIDRLACPWLIRRFIDENAVILYAPTAQVFEKAARERAIPFDIPGADFSHVGEKCSFDAFIEKFRLDDAGLAILAPIVRGADTGRPELAPEAAGLHAISLGLARGFEVDEALFEQGLILYDALYAWATKARGERHLWTPEKIR